jgi:hypothetical protein
MATKEAAKIGPEALEIWRQLMRSAKSEVEKRRK